MPTWLALTVTLLLLAMFLSATRIGAGWKAWDRADKITYAAFTVVVWPWLLTGYLTTAPLWYTVAAGAVTATALAVFVIRQARWLRQSKTLLAGARAEAERLMRQPGGDA